MTCILPNATVSRTGTGAILALSSTTLLSSLGSSIANVGLPELALAFDASQAEVQWVIIGYLLTSTALLVTCGRMGDAIGRRPLLLAGIALQVVGSALCALAPTLALLLAAREIQAVGAAATMALSLAMVSDAVPSSRTGAVMGLLGTMSAVGTALGPLVGGAVIAAFGWPGMFLAPLPLGAAAWVLARRHLPPAPSDADHSGRHAFDLAGTVILAVTLAAYALAMTPWRPLSSPVLLLAAIGGVALFVRVERRVGNPLVHLELLAPLAVRAGLVGAATVSAVVMSTLMVGPFYLTAALGLGPAQAGLVLSLGPAVAALTSWPSGRLVDHFGAARLGRLGLAAMAASAAALALIPVEAGLVGYAVPTMGLTAGYALFQAANNTRLMTGIPTDRRGLTSGLLTLARNLGLITGASTMAMVFALASGSDPTQAGPDAIAAGMHATFAVAALLLAAAWIFIRIVDRTASRPA